MNFDEYSNKAIDDRILKFGLNKEIFYPEVPLNNMSIDQLRWYVTFIANYEFDHIFSNIIKYEEKKKLINDLNEEFNRRFSYIFPIYEIMDKRYCKEKWNGEERYKILSYTFKGHDEMRAFRHTVKVYNKLKNLNIPIEFGVEIFTLFNENLYEYRNVPDDQQKNIDEQNEMVDLFLNIFKLKDEL
jgi:hypothetical protein